MGRYLKGMGGFSYTYTFAAQEENLIELAGALGAGQSSLYPALCGTLKDASEDQAFEVPCIPLLREIKKARKARGRELKFRCEGLQCKPMLQNLVETFEVGQVAKYEVIPSSIQWDDPLEPALVSVRFSN